MKTIDYLDAVKARLSLPSDYAAAPKLGVTRSSVSLYRKRGGTFNDSTALQVAKLLEIDPAIVLADMHAERSESPEVRAVWQDLHKRLASAAAAVLLAFVMVLGALPSPVFAAEITDPVYYVKYRKRLYTSLKFFKTQVFWRFADSLRKWLVFRSFTHSPPQPLPVYL